MDMLSADQIFSILFPPGDQDISKKVSDLEPQQWQSLLALGREHRFLPLLAYTIRKTASWHHLPKDVIQALDIAGRRHSRRALLMQRAIVQLHDIFQENRLAHVFLKGAYLAQFVYPEPGLRPMRDIDVLLSPKDLPAAHNILVSRGYRSGLHTQTTVSTIIDQSKHLPCLRTPDDKILIELHAHVDEPDGPLSGLDAFACVTHHPLAGRQLPFMGEQDMLIHLCVHAASFHSFNNGPLTVSDIGYLLRKPGLNLKTLAARSAELGVERPVALTLALTESCWPSRRDELPVGNVIVPHELVSDARKMCLAPIKQTQNFTLLAKLVSNGSSSQGLRALFTKIFPPRRILTMEFGQAGSRAELAWFHARRWYRIATQRIPAMTKLQKNSKFRDEFNRNIAMQNWLSGR
jgi:hypothetical protein